MENIERYIKEVQQFIDNNPDITEDILVRYVFLSLAKKLSFNMDYLPFGNSKKRQEIYKSVNSTYYVDKCLERKIVICNTASRILELVLSYFKINIRTVTDAFDIRRYPHVYNVVTPKDGREPYVIDLQEDMYRVQMNGRTPNYGINEDTDRYVISYFEQEEMDRRLGYIIDDNYYTDDYIYTLKHDISYMDSLYDKVKHVLENIEVIDNPSINYIDRQWYHVRILESLFDSQTFDYINNNRNIRIIDTYRMVNDVRIPINYIVVTDSGVSHIFVYKMNKQGYREITFDHMADDVRDGLVIHRNRIKEVEKIIKSAKG